MKTDVIAATKHWVKEVIIGLNFCPFAREVFVGKTIRFTSIWESDSADGTIGDAAKTAATIVGKVVSECRLMDDDTSIATCLMIMPDACADFYSFLDLLDRANDALYNGGYEGVYQLAHFHPEYCFSGEDPSDASNYTNRSPYPIIHILREADVEKALESYPHPEQIPERNIEIARQHGADFFTDILQESLRIGSCDENGSM